MTSVQAVSPIQNTVPAVQTPDCCLTAIIKKIAAAILGFFSCIARLICPPATLPPAPVAAAPLPKKEDVPKAATKEIGILKNVSEKLKYNSQLRFDLSSHPYVSDHKKLNASNLELAAFDAFTDEEILEHYAERYNKEREGAVKLERDTILDHYVTFAPYGMKKAELSKLHGLKLVRELNELFDLETMTIADKARIAKRDAEWNAQF